MFRVASCYNLLERDWKGKKKKKNVSTIKWMKLNIMHEIYTGTNLIIFVFIHEIGDNFFVEIFIS